MAAIDRCRCFLAWDVDQAGIERIAAAVRGYRAQWPDDGLRWIPACNWHVTMRFFGDLDSPSIEAVRDCVDRVWKSRSGAVDERCRLVRIGPFPRRGGRVVALALRGSGSWWRLARTLGEELDRLRSERSRRSWRPHLTVARARGSLDGIAAHSLDESVGLPSITLYRSDLRPEGARYTPLSHWRLDQRGCGR